MDELWFEDELALTEEDIDDVVKSTDGRLSEVERQARNTVRGIVRVDKPRWDEIDAAAHKLLTSGQQGTRFYLVRLGFQFDIPPEAYSKGSRFIYARCSAYLSPANVGQPQPTVYAVIPSSLYEGEPRQVSVEIGPEIKLGTVSGTIGKASTNLMVGTVEPAIVGYHGEDDRAPYWEIRPTTKTLLGVHHLWLVIEVPFGASGVLLAAQAEGDVQTRFGPIPIGPRTREWAERPSIMIPHSPQFSGAVAQARIDRRPR